MTPPSTYAQWVDCLLQIKEEKPTELELLDIMESGTIVWSSGVAENLARRFAETFNLRLKIASDLFQLELTRATAHENHIVGPILGLRKRLGFLQRFANLKPLHPEIHKSLNDALDRFCVECQKSLEDGAKRDRTGRLSQIIRNNPIKITPATQPVVINEPDPTSIPATNGRPLRKILFH